MIKALPDIEDLDFFDFIRPLDCDSKVEVMEAFTQKKDPVRSCGVGNSHLSLHISHLSG